MHFVYILESAMTKEKYVGSTETFDRRLFEAKQRKNIVMSHGHHWYLIYAEAYLHRKDAENREKFLASFAGRKFLEDHLSHYLQVNS